MTTGLIAPSPRLFWLSSAGAILPGARLYTYLAGSSTPQATYSDRGLSVANANPVEADTYGLFPAIYFPNVALKCILKTSADVEVWTQDYVSTGAIRATDGYEWNFGGSLVAYEAAAAADTYTDLPDSSEIEINGDNIGTGSVYFEINAKSGVATNVTITCRLYNTTLAAAVASSAVAVVNPGALTRVRAVSAALTLAAGANSYKAQIKRSVITVAVAARARLYTG